MDREGGNLAIINTQPRSSAGRLTSGGQHSSVSGPVVEGTVRTIRIPIFYKFVSLISFEHTEGLPPQVWKQVSSEGCSVAGKESLMSTSRIRYHEARIVLIAVAAYRQRRAAREEQTVCRLVAEVDDCRRSGVLGEVLHMLMRIQK